MERQSERLNASLNAVWVEVFVYGTLLPGECNHAYLANGIFVADDAVENAELYDEGSYPLLRPGTGTVYGKLYRVPAADLDALDALEEHPDFFYRCLLPLASERLAWVYVGPEDYAKQLPKIPSGCWWHRSSNLQNG